MSTSVMTRYRRFLTPEVLAFLTVGGLGYVVDVGVFNWLRSTATLGNADPSLARILAVVVAMVVTYFGNRTVTWRDVPAGDRRREVLLFIVFNIIGLGFSVVTLWISHDLLGLTTRLADNISANVVGLALGTIFRFWSYKRFVFTSREAASVDLPPGDEDTYVAFAVLHRRNCKD